MNVGWTPALLVPILLASGCAKTDYDRKLDKVDVSAELRAFLEAGKTPYARWLARNLDPDQEPSLASENWDLWQLTWTDNFFELQEVPPPQPRKNLRLVARKLEELERECAPTIWVHSAYRSPGVNRAVGGANSSRHLEGLAADISFPGSGEHSIKTCLCHRARAGICEMYVEGKKHYIHMGLCRYLEQPQPLAWCKGIRPP